MTAHYEMEPALNSRLVDLNIEQYHEESEHDSSTTIRLFASSPAHYKAVREGKMTFKQSDPQRLGSLDHVVLTELEKLDQLVAIKPANLMSEDGGLRTKEAKLWKFDQERLGKIVCSQQELDEALLLREAVMANPATRRVIEEATIREQSIFWETSSHKLKVRVDLGIELAHEIYDVKRVSTSIDYFWTSVRDYRYGCQAALYQDGYESYYHDRPKFFWLLVSPNLRCRVEQCPPELLEAGRHENAKSLFELNECRAGLRPWLREDDTKVGVLDCPPFMTPAEPSHYESV